MSGLGRPAAVGLDHIGIAVPDLDAAASDFAALGFHVTPRALHAGGRTANRCVMLRDGGYLELMAIVPGHRSATLERFLAHGPGAHSLAMEVADEQAAAARLRRAGFDAVMPANSQRDAGFDGRAARFSLIMPPDPPEGRVFLVRHLTRELLWRSETTAHPNGALALREAVYAVDVPAETTAFLSRVSGRAAEPDPLGGYRIPLGRGEIRVLPRTAAAALFPGPAGAWFSGPAGAGAPMIGLTLAAEAGREGVLHAAGVSHRFIVP